MNGKRRYYCITFRGKALGGFWLGKTKDAGFSFGLIFDGGGPHLTFLEKNGKIGYHITHEGSKEPSEKYPLDSHKSTKLVGNTILKMLSRTLVNYHGNKKCWLVTPKRWEKIKSMQSKADGESLTNLPLELLGAELDMDLSNGDLWQRVPIRSLLYSEPRVALMESKRGSLNLIWPVSKTQLMSFSFSKLGKLIAYLEDISGMKDFFNYIKETEEGKRFWAEFMGRLGREVGRSSD